MTASRLRPFRLAPEGLPARFALGLLATAGILYANISPVIVSGLAAGPDFTAETAGYVFSANMYGNALGGFLAIFLVARVQWRPVTVALLVLIAATDLVSVWADGASTLMLIRFCHGLVSGALMGVVTAVIARTTSPERTFAIFIGVQLTLGGIGAAVLTRQIADMGADVVWFVLAGYSVLALGLTTLLDDYPILPGRRREVGARDRAGWPPIALALGALFLYQAAQMATFAYVIELGNRHLFDADFVSLALAVSLWVGGPAALLVTWWSTRSGRFRPVSMGIVLTAASLLLLLPESQLSFFAGNAGFGIFFSLTFPYLLGVAAEMDNSGRLAAVAGFTSSLGLATGPAIAAMLIAGGDVDRVVMFSIALMMASAALVARPARLLDGLNKHGRVAW